MKLLTIVAAAVVALTITVTTTHAQRSTAGPHIGGATGGHGGKRGTIRPCSGLSGPGSCAPGPSIDVGRYIPRPRQALSGGLRLQIRPAHAGVYVDGRYVGPVSKFDGTSQRLPLSPGSHSVVIRASGYEPLEIATLTRVGQTTVYRATLLPSNGLDNQR